MALQRISDLTAGTPPYSSDSLLEISVPTGASPPFASYKAQLAEITAAFAPLASPVFTGTPSLPTGTTAITQAAGTNNTTLATAAFTQGPKLGVTTNSDAAAGYIGEYLTATSASTAVTSGVPANVASLSLTAGDWDVEGMVLFTAGGTTVVNQLTIGLSSDGPSATPAQGTLGRNDIYGIALTGLAMSLFVGRQRFSLAATTTVYLNQFTSFTTAAMTRAGTIAARRVR